MDSRPIHHTTRIRLPSARLRQSPDPPHRPIRKILPAPQIFKDFPPANVTLHPEDANSKVFAAIARALLSVDNRAMTIKDLTEMTAQHGLACQNLSATSQAITTYIRTHLHRCDQQSDQPLLNKVVLSGTPADDDLLPALYSRSGGAHVASKDGVPRVTNFRKGTMVWYLSRITGAPCPFAKAGIRLCDYVDLDREEPCEVKRPKKTKGHRERESRRLAARAEEEHCGQKRKRSLRPSVSDDDDDDDDDEDEDESSEEERPPPTKIKLTLKLKPLARFSTAGPSSSSRHYDSDSYSSDEDDNAQHPTSARACVLPPYPRRSISIPTYTPSVDFQSYASYPSCYSYRRSPSVPYSVASAPPDSGDEYEYPDLDCDSSDVSVQGSSPPRSPSAPLLSLMIPASSAASQPRVKEEPTDVQGILDAWEDLDHFRESEFGKPLSAPNMIDITVKGEESPFLSSSPLIKTEEIDVLPFADSLDLSFQQWRSTNPFDGLSSPLMSPVSVVSPTSPLTPFSFAYESRHAEPDDLASATIRPRAKTCSSLPSLDSFVADVHTLPPAPQASFSQSLTALVESLTFLESAPACVSPQQIDIRAWGGELSADADSAVVVKTCKPSDPEIQATQVEGISVYQMKLGSRTLLRRIDTDFVNLAPILALSDSSSPGLTLIPHAVLVNTGTELVRGTWVSLPVAQTYLKDHPNLSFLCRGLTAFLSDSLVDQFPDPLREFVANLKNNGRRLDGQFGKSFGSMLQARDVASQVPVASAEEEVPLSLLPAIDTYGLQESPLTASEQEIFQAFLVPAAWDKENVGSSPACTSTPPRHLSKPLTIITSSNTRAKDVLDMEDEPLTPIESSPCSARSMSVERACSARPLRRSKRVQDAAAARSRTKAKSRNHC